MSDQLDNDLKNRIREVFENYQDDSADAGWLLLREKFPEEKKRRLLGWWWYSAAAVLLLCFGIWFVNPTAKKQVAVNTNKTIDKHSRTSVEVTPQTTAPRPAGIPKLADRIKTAIVDNLNSGINKNHQAQLSAVKLEPANTPSTFNNAPLETAAGIAENIRPTAKNEVISTMMPATVQTQNTAAGKRPLTTMVQAAATPENALTLNVGRQNMAKAKQPMPSNTMHADSITTGNAASGQQLAENIAEKTTQQQQAVVQQTVTAKPKEDALLNMMKADDARQQATLKKQGKKDEVKSNRARMLSIYAATYFNYAKGSENQVNVGAGFTSDFRITNNLKFTTGLSIAQNQLNYSNGNLPTQINNKVAVAAASSDVARTNILSSSLLGIQTSPTAKNYNASLVGLDLPLNLKYQFNPNKNDTYISAGISSGTYINETYRSTYSYGGGSNSLVNSATAFAVTNNAVTNQTQESTTNQHFSTFDFAKTLNISFGIGYPLGRNRLIIEPFLKYPLGGLGAQNISFGSSGINLKLNFRTSKK